MKKKYLQLVSSNCESGNLFADPGHRQRYFVPHGGLFEYVSCPNYLCEIVVYVGLQVVLGFDHFPWTLITVWVVINQVNNSGFRKSRNYTKTTILICQVIGNHCGYRFFADAGGDDDSGVVPAEIRRLSGGTSSHPPLRLLKTSCISFSHFNVE